MRRGFGRIDLERALALAEVFGSSLVNFNVTLGYAVNPCPRFQEGRGAFFFSMDVTDLFR